jgi:DNA-binding CsgD family transcriptional regulator
MALSSSGAGGGRPTDPHLGPEVIDLIHKSHVPAVLLQVPDEMIIAASQAAQQMLGDGHQTIEGHSFEDYTIDEPSGGMELMQAGRLNGYESSRQLRSAQAGSIPGHVWVQSFDDGIPPHHAVCIVSTNEMSTATPIPMVAERELPPVIGTADENLVIDRVTTDVNALIGYDSLELLGHSVLELVSVDDVARWLAAIAQATMARGGVTMEIHARHSSGSPLACDAFILAMVPMPSCGFVLMPHPAGADLTARTHVGQDLSRLYRDVQALTLSGDLAAATIQRRMPEVSLLSARELEIVSRLLRGDRVPAIARGLFVSQSTVRNHLAHVYTKLGVGSQQELIDLFRHGEADHDDA